MGKGGEEKEMVRDMLGERAVCVTVLCVCVWKFVCVCVNALLVKELYVTKLRVKGCV